MIINFNILEMLFTSKPKTWVNRPTARYWNVLSKVMERNNENQLETNWASKKNGIDIWSEYWLILPN